MLWFLIGIIAVLFAYSFLSREHFLSAFGYEILNVSIFKEDTCKPGEENDAGLCYIKCKSGYHGIGPVCWADTTSIGVGTVIGLEPCPNGWFTEGLTCREPITGGGCNTHCDGTWNSSDGGFCHTHCDPLVGGHVVGRLDHGGVCPGPQGGDKPDRVDGMCYGKCPVEKPVHFPGMPFLCYVGGGISYPRGAGKVPHMFRVIGKYAFLGGTD